MFKINKIYKTSRDDIAINIRFPEEIYNKYKEISKKTGYSFNGLVINAMNYALENMEEDKKQLNILVVYEMVQLKSKKFKMITVFTSKMN